MSDPTSCLFPLLVRGTLLFSILLFNFVINIIIIIIIIMGKGEKGKEQNT